MSDKYTKHEMFFLSKKTKIKNIRPPDLLSDNLDGLPVEPEVHLLVLRHDLPAIPPDQRLLDEECDPLLADGDTGTSVRYNL